MRPLPRGSAVYLLLSPAKRLVEPPAADVAATVPELLDHTKLLVERARALSVEELQRLMDIGEPLAELTRARFHAVSFPFTRENARQAALTFAGDVYRGLDAGTLDEATLLWGQDHLGILSGLYGLLRPLDLVQPYRLEMGTPLDNPRGPDLYAFWRAAITEAVARRVRAAEAPVVVNLASHEYFDAVDASALPVPVITPVFQDVKGGKARTLGFFAKQARGTMARWVLTERVVRPDDLRAFEGDGYRYDASASDGARWVFRRPQPPPVGTK